MLVWTFSIDAPKIKQDIQSETVNESEAVYLNCIADGNPVPQVMWIFKNQTMATGSQQNTLMISKVTGNDAGEYTCTAENDLGFDTRTVSLKVESKSDVIDVNEIQRICASKW